MNPDTNLFESLREDPEAIRRELDTLRQEINDTAQPPNRAQRRRLEREAAKTARERRSLVRPDGSPVPKTWTTFGVGEKVEIKGYTFEVTDIGEDRIVFKPVGPMIVGHTSAG